MTARFIRTIPIGRLTAAGLMVCLGALAEQDTAPDASQQERILNAMQSYSEQYVANLPNFICEQVTRQYEAGRKPKGWRQGDTLMYKLLFSKGEEHRNLELVNEKPLRPGMRRWRVPLHTEGEFGILLANVFSAASDASYTWKGWQIIRGRRVAVFDYSIDAAHSTLRLGLGDLAEAVVPYHGSVYGDPESGAVWRIENAAADLPKKLDTKSIATRIDYDDVAIGGKSYLLPVQASIWLATEVNHIHNELEFRNYRKFEADSVIKYASAEDGKD